MLFLEQLIPLPCDITNDLRMKIFLDRNRITFDIKVNYIFFSKIRSMIKRRSPTILQNSNGNGTSHWRTIVLFK